MENRRRELERIKRNRKRQLRRRLAAAGVAVGVVCLAVGIRMRDTDTDRVGGGGDVSAENSGMYISGSESAELPGTFLAEAGSFLQMDGTSAGERSSVTETLDVRESAGLTEREITVAFVPSEELPPRFDLRERGTAPVVPDQGTFGTCWAFASLGALESSMPERLRVNLSADHMSIQNSFGLGQDAGGDYSISSAYLLAWQGPVAEAEDPYGDGVSPEQLEPMCHVQEIQILPEKDYEAVKRAVYETGGVQSSFYMPQTDGAERDRYYNEETYAFYYDGSLEANHDVVIVGWEDSYPKENFVKEPSEDGAFLCMNTWGESFGDRGYFYISYEDSRIGSSNVSYTGIEPVGNYDAVYQTDLCGWTGQLGYGASNAWFANVYEAEADGVLSAAGFYATVPDCSYRVYVTALEGSGRWQQVSGMPGPGEAGDAAIVSEALAARALVAEGRVANAGYYTVAWNEEIPLDAGETFAVLVEIESPNTKEPVAVEYRANDRTGGVDIGDGVGYISPDGVHWQRAETELQCNVCLKAYVRNK